MLTSLSLIFLVGLAMGAICQKIKLPRIIGMPVSYTHLDVYKRQPLYDADTKKLSVTGA